MMTQKEAGQYMGDRSRGVIRPGLSRTYELLRRLGDPQEKLKYIHIAGTNGKGSTCAMLESILRQAGYRTGLYTSPHLLRVNEEIRINGCEITDAAYSDLIARVSEHADRMKDPPTAFEIMTAAAILYFYESRCEIVVTECGMGGLLDATNVIPAPEVCVITNIGMDHTAYLGDTAERICENKAGIIKPGTRAACYDLPDGIREVINAACRHCAVPVRYADFGQLFSAEHSVTYRGKTYPLFLAGTYQAKNAAVALEAVCMLRDAGWDLSEDAVKKGLGNVRWPARFEILRKDPLLVIDGGHNAQCADAFAESLKSLIGARKLNIVLGMLRDKDYEAVIDILSPFAECFYCVAPENDRALPADELAGAVRAKGYKACAFRNIANGLSAAEKTGIGVAAFGSLYLAGALLRIYTDQGS